MCMSSSANAGFDRAGRHSFPSDETTSSVRIPGLFRDLGWIAALAAISLGLGLAGDQCLRANPLTLSYMGTPLPGAGEASNELDVVSLDEVAEILQRSDVIILDARPRVIHAMGHVPKAWSLSWEEFKDEFGTLESKLSDHSGDIIVYCQDISCGDGAKVAHALIEHGIAGVRLFAGGITEWENAGYPLEVSP